MHVFHLRYFCLCCFLLRALIAQLVSALQRAERNLRVWRSVVEAREAFKLVNQQSYREFYRRVDALWEVPSSERNTRIKHAIARINAGMDAAEAVESAVMTDESPIVTRTRSKYAVVRDDKGEPATAEPATEATAEDSCDEDTDDGYAPCIRAHCDERAGRADHDQLDGVTGELFSDETHRDDESSVGEGYYQYRAGFAADAHTTSAWSYGCGVFPESGDRENATTTAEESSDDGTTQRAGDSETDTSPPESVQAADEYPAFESLHLRDEAAGRHANAPFSGDAAPALESCGTRASAAVAWTSAASLPAPKQDCQKAGSVAEVVFPPPSRANWRDGQERLIRGVGDKQQRFRAWTDILREEKARLWSESTFTNMKRVVGLSRVVLSEHILLEVSRVICISCVRI
jgi:hypothetical protein